MKSRKLVLLMVFAVLSAAATVAWAEKMEAGSVSVSAAGDDFLMPAPPVPPMHFNVPASPMAGAMHLMMMLDELDLDTKQREQVGKIMDSTMPKARDLMFRMSDSRKAMEQAMEDRVTDEQVLRKLADDQGRLAADLTFLHLKARADLRAVLTEEQMDKLEGFRRGHAFFKRFHSRRD